MAEIRSYLSGPRWVGARPFLEDCAIKSGVRLKAEKESGLIRETVYFTAIGDRERLLRFRELLEDAVGRYRMGQRLEIS